MLILSSAKLPLSYQEELLKKFIGAEIFLFDMRVKSAVYDSILSHPDIYFFEIQPKVFVHAPNVPLDIIKIMENRGAVFLKGKSIPLGLYPATCAYNGIRIGKKILHNLKITDSVIISESKKLGLELRHVPQGYTRCSVVKVNDNALITADKGIAEAAIQAGIDVLTIVPGFVTLYGEKYGFLGGASGNTREGDVIFLGDIKAHPDFENIAEFFTKHGVNWINLNSGILYDAGTLIVL
ncbi:hypothetical protein OMAG_000991 [Candidatus Omnitrophus magneticus]|uniref:DUF6873 domain-containing protein n=1 Tax=Candidatus Omnitrophus magneticus TaxID=1609969 RepID=A0A0F0CP72_9BACT|nr:hypothetical protein OMAG_000991 [Candidatus Omnitrophus magneticus]